MDKDKDKVKEQLEAVYKELSVSDPRFVKFRCPICKGYGVARGRLAGPRVLSTQKIGKCHYCSGTGVARRRKRHYE